MKKLLNKIKRLINIIKMDWVAVGVFITTLSFALYWTVAYWQDFVMGCETASGKAGGVLWLLVVYAARGMYVEKLIRRLRNHQ